jgi:hypothetical protein
MSRAAVACLLPWAVQSSRFRLCLPLVILLAAPFAPGGSRVRAEFLTVDCVTRPAIVPPSGTTPTGGIPVVWLDDGPGSGGTPTGSSDEHSPVPETPPSPDRRPRAPSPLRHNSHGGGGAPGSAGGDGPSGLQASLAAESAALARDRAGWVETENGPFMLSRTSSRLFRPPRDGEGPNALRECCHSIRSKTA